MRTSRPSLLWVYDGSLARALDHATWLEPSAILNDQGWQVTIAARDLPQDADKRIRVLCLPRPGAFVLGYLIFHVSLLLKLATANSRPDIIMFGQTSAPFLLPLVLVRKLLRRQTPKFVMDVRTLVMSDYTTLRSRLWTLMFSISHKLACWLADGQTAITLRMAQAAGIPERQLLGVWPSAVKVELFTPAISARRWPDRLAPLRFVYAGALYSERNLLSLCEAMVNARREGLDVRLRIVGNGPQRRELEAFAGGIEKDAIMVCAAVPYCEMPALLAAAHIGVLPFPNRLAFRVSSPVKMYEYMAAGLPILATRIACHTEVIGNGNYVIWAEDGSPAALTAAIKTAYAKKDELCNMGGRAATAAKVCTWDESANRLSKALQTVMNGTRS